MTTRHIPVLLDEVVDALRPRAGERFIDATFGAGGYSRAILEADDVRVLALDRDPSAVAAGAKFVSTFAPRLVLDMAPFSRLLDWCEDEAPCALYKGQFDGVVFDLGVSSMQLDTPARGFSFQADGPLDMRMFSAGAEQGGETGLSAADVVNGFDEKELADILFQLGEEKRSRAIARAIVARRQERVFSRTLDLAGLIASVLGSGGRGGGRHPATRSFQALRMFVNDEIGELVRGLLGAERCLRPGGRLVVVTFHSLEDRIVKRFIAQRAGRDEGVSRHLPAGGSGACPPSLEIVNRRSLTSSKGELDVNPRARSARLRACVRTEAAAFPASFDNLGVPGLVRDRLSGSS